MSGILGYSAADFDGYFRGAWMRHPEKEDVLQISNVMRGAVLMRSSEGDVSIPNTSITWDLVSCSDLGYRNLGENIVIHITKRPGRNTRKGIASNTLTVAPAICYSIAVAGSGKIVDEYGLNRAKGRETAQALYFPKFPDYTEALTRILDESDKAFALAISPHCVISLDPNKDNHVLCTIDETNVGSYSVVNGRWSWFTPCARDMAQRQGVNV